MEKSPDAFRTISEVGEVLETPAHVLRFWESRFPQIRPVKRAGGRRYYRPADVALLTGIKHLLHNEGMTIRGVQKILREQGVRFVASLSGREVPDEAEDAEAALEAALAANFGTSTPVFQPQAEVESAQIVALEIALRAKECDPDAPALPPAEVRSLFDAVDAVPPAPRWPTAPRWPAATPEPGRQGRSAEGPLDNPKMDSPEEVPEAGHWIDPDFDLDPNIEALMADPMEDDSPWPADPQAEAVPAVSAAEGFGPTDTGPTDARFADALPTPEGAGAVSGDLSDAVRVEAPLAGLSPDLPPDLPPADTQPADIPQIDAPLIDRLRALPAGALDGSLQATALRDRLAALAVRVSSSPPQVQF